MGVRKPNAQGCTVWSSATQGGGVGVRTLPFTLRVGKDFQVPKLACSKPPPSMSSIQGHGMTGLSRADAAFNWGRATEYRIGTYSSGALKGRREEGTRSQKADNCGECQDPMATHKRRRHPVRPRLNIELAQRPGHSAYLMGSREESSDAATDHPFLHAWQQKPRPWIGPC